MYSKGQKNEVINSLIENFKSHDCFYMIDITSLNVEKNMLLRRQCYDSNIKMKVAKNSLIYLALKGANIDNLDNDFIQQNCLKNISALLFINEQYNLPGKILFNFKKSQFNKLELKCAYLNGEFFSGKDKLSYLATLKTKNEIIAEIVYSCLGKLSMILLSLLKHKEASENEAKN